MHSAHLKKNSPTLTRNRCCRSPIHVTAGTSMLPCRHHVGIAVVGRSGARVGSTKTRWKTKGRFAGAAGSGISDGRGERLALNGSHPVPRRKETSIHGRLRYWHFPTTIAERIFRRVQATTANYQSRSRRRDTTTRDPDEKAFPTRPTEWLRGPHMRSRPR